jgi:hypothetical protein
MKSGAKVNKIFESAKTFAKKKLNYFFSPLLFIDL